ncbi:MAG: hypothetical protein QXG08_01015 [Candidatus Methanomethyliaceae archaeon]
MSKNPFGITLSAPGLLLSLLPLVFLFMLVLGLAPTPAFASTGAPFLSGAGFVLRAGSGPSLHAGSDAGFGSLVPGLRRDGGSGSRMKLTMRSC